MKQLFYCLFKNKRPMKASEKAPDTETAPGCQLNQKINQAANQHRRNAQIHENQQPARGRDPGLIDVVAEYGLGFFPLH